MIKTITPGKKSRYLLSTTEIYFLILIGLSIFASAFPLLGADSKDEMLMVLYSAPYYLWIYCLVLVMLWSVGLYVQFFPMLLSFNCTRKRLFISMQSIFLLLGVQTLALGTVFSLFIKNDITASFLALLPLLSGILLTATGLGQLIGGIAARYGKPGLILMLGLCMIGGGLIGGIVGFSGDSIHFLLVEHQAFLIEHLNLLTLIIGLLIYLLCAYFDLRLLKKAAVH